MSNYVDVLGLNFSLDELRSKNVEEVEQIVKSVKMNGLVTGICFRVSTEGDLSILKDTDEYSIHYLPKREKFYFSLAVLEGSLFIQGTYVIKAFGTDKKPIFILTGDSDIAEFIILAIKRNYEFMKESKKEPNTSVKIVVYTHDGFTISDCKDYPDSSRKVDNSKQEKKEDSTSSNTIKNEDYQKQVNSLKAILCAIKREDNPYNESKKKCAKKQHKQAENEIKGMTLEDFLKSLGTTIQ